MPSQNNALEDRLSWSTEITITVTGRTSGRSISIPVWFVLEDDQLYLLPVQGSDTQWYKNVLKNPAIRVKVGDTEEELHAQPVTDPKEVSTLADKLRKKYGADNVKKYYSNFDVAVLVRVR